MSCPPLNNQSLESTLDILIQSTYMPDRQWLYIFTDVFELVCIGFSSVVVGFGLYVFVKAPVFHQHLIRLFYCIATVYYFIMLFRVTPIVIHLYWGRPICELSYLL